MPGRSSPLGSGGGRPAAAGGASRRPRISIALCTHDGARFLPAQLESLLRQSRTPDELVACDDRSTDGTVAILEDFAGKAPFPVRIERNPTQLRSTRNFEKAIGLCTGDLIATCDQDDVWLPEKLALCEAAFSADARLGLVFTDAEIVGEDLRPMGYRLWETIHLGKREQHRIRSGRGFDLLLRQWLVTGATMVFRAEHRSLVLPIPECWIHDGWIAFLLGAVAPIGIVDRPTVLYRQHPGQQIGARRLTSGELYEVARSMGPAYFRTNHDRVRLARERLREFADRVVDPDDLERVDRKLAHQARRLAISESPSRARRILLALDELLHGRYARFSPAFSHALKDMFL
jgi:glycosyltransferase involved in cell wall biosynthesis